MRKFHAIIIAVGAFALTCCSAAFAAPMLSVNITSDLSSWSAQQAGTSTATDNVYQYTGQHSSSAGDYTMNWDLTADADPFVNGNMVVTNTSGVTQTFSMTVNLPVSPAITPTSLLGGSISGTLSADGTGGTLSSSGSDPIYTALIDGLTAATLLNSPTSVSAGPFLSGTLGPASFGTPIPSQPGPAINSTIGITLKFSLTPGDQASFTSVFVAQAPEPASLALLALVAPVLARRRRFC